MKALRLNVYRHDWNDPDYDPTNGGVSGRCNEILVPCPEGPWDVDPDNPPENLFQLCEKRVFGLYLYLAPYSKTDEQLHMAGPMFGGNYAETSDGRWARMLRSRYGMSLGSTCLPIHDRYETWEAYEALSR